MSVNVPEPNVTEIDAEQQDDAVIGRALRWSLLVFLCVGLIVAGIVYAVTRPNKKESIAEAHLADLDVRELPPVLLPYVPFSDITHEAGITFVHENGAYGDKLLPETMGGGMAF